MLSGTDLMLRLPREEAHQFLTALDTAAWFDDECRQLGLPTLSERRS